MSDPYGYNPPEQQRSKRQEHFSQMHRNVQRRRNERDLAETVYSTAERSGDPYMQELATTSRAVGSLGLDGREFFKAPGAYQAALEREDAEPKGFLQRMRQRAEDGILLNRRGRVGMAALMGNTDLDAALQEAANLRGQMSSQEYLAQQRGIEQHLGMAAEIVGQQLPNLPLALTGAAAAAGTGALLGLAGGPAGALAGAGAAAGTGFTIGMFAENSMMMAGLEFLDYMETPLRMPDGTEVRMPVEIARAAALSVGVLSGALETAQVTSWAGKIPGAKQAASKVLGKLAGSSRLREIVIRYGTRHALGTGENVLEEMVQEVTSVVGTEIALDITRNKTGAEAVEARQTADEIRRRLGEIAKMSPAFGILSGPQAVVGSLSDSARVNPERVFSTDRGGEVVPIGNLQLPDHINERMRVSTEAVIDAAERGVVKLPAVATTTDDAGKVSVGSPEDQALVAGLRARGFLAVRTVDEMALAEAEAAEAEAAATEGEGEGEAETEAKPEVKPKRGPVPIRSMSAFEAIQQQFLEGTAETEITPEQATMATIILERAAQAQGKDLMTVAREWFQDERIFADEQAAAEILQTLRPERTPDEPAAPVEPTPAAPTGPTQVDTTPLEVEPDERGAEGTEDARDETQADTADEPPPEVLDAVEPVQDEPPSVEEERGADADQDGEQGPQADAEGDGAPDADAVEPVQDEPPSIEPEVSAESTVAEPEIARQPGQSIEDWWENSLTTEGRRQALRRAGFPEPQIERISRMDTRHMDDAITDVLEREFPDLAEEGIPAWARANFDAQQSLMRRLPNNIGKAQQEGTLTQRQRDALVEIERLRERLPDDSDLWQRIMQEDRDQYDRALADTRAANRAETDARMVAEGWAIGDKVWLPEQNMLTGQLIYRLQGTVKINVHGDAYVAGDGKQFSLFDNRWTRVGEEPAAPPRAAAGAYRGAGRSQHVHRNPARERPATRRKRHRGMGGTRRQPGGPCRLLARPHGAGAPGAYGSAVQRPRGALPRGRWRIPRPGPRPSHGSHRRSERGRAAAGGDVPAQLAARGAP